MKINGHKLRVLVKKHLIYRNERFDKDLPYSLESQYNRSSIVNYACHLINAKSYLEIGCFRNETFHSIIAMNKVGVDPERGGTHRMTSDEFFVQNTEKFDVIFIDGLHLYEQVHKDIANSLNALKKGGMIVLDDMLPLNWALGSRNRVNHKLWLGDTWKCNFEINATEGLEYKLILCDHGTGVIKPKANHAPLVNMSNEVAKAGFSYLYENHKKLPIIEAEAGLKWMSDGR